MRQVRVRVMVVRGQRLCLSAREAAFRQSQSDLSYGVVFVVVAVSVVPEVT